MVDSVEKKTMILRLKRIEGQLRGLQRMVEEGAPCADILTQVAAATGAMKKVGREIVETHMSECLEKLPKAARGKGESMRDLREAIGRYMDWA